MQRAIGYRGFSLVELLVVMLIVSLGVSLVLMRTDDNLDYRVRLTLKQFANQVRLISEEAVLGNRQWGLDFYRTSVNSGDTNYGYRWLTKDEEGWSVAAPADMEKEMLLPREIEVALEVEGARQEIESRVAQSAEGEAAPQPDVQLFSSGEITPFSLKLMQTEKPETARQIEVDQLARVLFSGDRDANSGY